MIASRRSLTALLATACAVAVPVPALAGFTCSGTEPFWDLSANKGIAIESPEGGKRNYAKASLSWAGTTRIYKAKKSGLPAITVAIRVDRSCSDGMSDDVYPYAVRVSVPGENTLNGCCRKW
jgi:uncharacterized membrane protein